MARRVPWGKQGLWSPGALSLLDSWGVFPFGSALPSVIRARGLSQLNGRADSATRESFLEEPVIQS